MMGLDVIGPILKQVTRLATVLLFAPCAFGNIYYVSTTGNDAPGNGTINNPWKTLKYAVGRVAPAMGHIIQVSAGTFVEAGPIEIPPGVSVEGAGVNQTIFRSNSSFYYNPASPGNAPEKFLFSLSAFDPSNGNQTLSHFSIDGDSKKLHGGIYVRYRNNVIIEDVNVQYTNFSGIWLWDVKDSKIKNVYLLNCSWGSTGYSAGALNLGNIERVEIDQLDVDENTGYGIKAIGPVGYNDIFHLKIHDSHISVSPTGLWNNGTAPNIAIELWHADLVGCEIYNCYVDNTISIVNSNQIPSTGIQTIRVHHNTIDLETRAHGAGYGIELTFHDAEIDHNYFIKGTSGIANWDNPVQNWSIHHNVFYALEGTYPGEIVRSQWSGLHNLKLYNNTIEFTGNKTINVIGLYGGASNDLELKNNLVVNSTTGFTQYPNELIHTENGASISGLKILKNSIGNLEPGGLLRSILQFIGGVFVPTPDIDLTNPTNPAINKTGARPDPYYLPVAGSSLIDAGSNVGYSYLGSSPDIGALEYGSTPSPNSPPRVNITSPAGNTSLAQGTPLSITANASDNDGTISRVEFFAGSTKIGEDLTNPYSFTWTNAPAGSHALTAKATDNQNAATTSAAATVVVNGLNQAPVVSITSPANNSVFLEGASITIAVNASDPDGTVSKVEFFSGTMKLGEDLTSPFSFTLSNAPIGSHTLTAKATDNQNTSGLASAITLNVVNKNLNPTVSLISPVDSAQFATGTPITIAAQALDSDGSIVKVEFYRDEEKLGEDNTSPYTFEWNNPSAGGFLLSAKATDNQGGEAMSPAIAVELVESALQVNSFIVYPNPSSGKFTIQYVPATPQSILIKIVDMSPRLVLQKTVEIFAGQNYIEVDASPIAPGIYLLWLQTPDGERFAAKLLIEK